MNKYFKTAYSEKTHTDRYAQLVKDSVKETVFETFARVTYDNKAVYDMMVQKEFMTGGRILCNMGGTGNNVAGQCFVNSLASDSLKAINKCLSDTALIYAKGGGVGTNFSTLRPKDAPIQGASHGSSGVCSFIDVFDSYADIIRQGGKRRAAKMTVLNVDHPDVEEFIHAKTDHKRWSTTNVSVGVSNKFMVAVQNNDDWDLVFNNKVYKTIKAKELWDDICDCAFRSGEPGVVFLDTINDKFPLRYKYKIDATNPCGEQPLPKDSMCLLGSMVLSSFVKDKEFDFDSFGKKVRIAVQYLDSLIDISKYTLKAIEKMVKKTRPIGLGYTALADALFLMEIPYGANEACLTFVDNVTKFMYETAKDESEKLAEKNGAFPDYDFELADFLPRRNSTLLSFAPTGSITAMVGAGGYGVEPFFAPTVVRNENLGRDVVNIVVVDEYMQSTQATEFPEWARFVGGTDAKYSLTTEDHLEVLKIIASHCDSAVSKTVNLPQDASVDFVHQVYEYCYANGIKGCTVYVDKCRDDQPVSWGSDDSDSEDDDELDDSDIEVIEYVTHPKKRPSDVDSCTYELKFSPEDPKMYITIGDYDQDVFEIFFKVNNAKHQEYLDALSRAITSLWRRGIRAEHLFEEFCDYESPNAGSFYENMRGKRTYLRSILHGIGLVVQKHFHKLDIDDDIDVASHSCSAVSISGKGKKCPECKEYTLMPIEGCMTCQNCGYSRCG